MFGMFFIAAEMDVDEESVDIFVQSRDGPSHSTSIGNYKLLKKKPCQIKFPFQLISGFSLIAIGNKTSFLKCYR